MHAMVLKAIGRPLEWSELPGRQPGPGQVPAKVSACGACRTDLNAVDGELAARHGPIIPGQEIVGRIDALGRPRQAPEAVEVCSTLSPFASKPVSRLDACRYRERQSIGQTDAPILSTHV